MLHLNVSIQVRIRSIVTAIVLWTGLTSPAATGDNPHYDKGAPSLVLVEHKV